MKKLFLVLLACLFVLPAVAFATDGTFSAQSAGFGGPVTVTLTLEGDKITDAVVEGENETAGIGAGRVGSARRAAARCAERRDRRHCRVQP